MTNLMEGNGRRHCYEHAGFVEKLDEGQRQRDKIFKKLDAINNWLMGIAGGLILSLILLIINLLTKK